MDVSHSNCVWVYVHWDIWIPKKVLLSPLSQFYFLCIIFLKGSGYWLPINIFKTKIMTLLFLHWCLTQEALHFPSLFSLPVGGFEQTSKENFPFLLYIYSRRMLPMLNTTCYVLCRKIAMTELSEHHTSYYSNAFDKFKKIVLYYHNYYGYQPWEGGDLPLGYPTLKITWPFNHVILRDYVTN